ncbi:hypothetical protein [Agriterribacter sp.]|uniref:hypothetical protein n=1 Tax=Agriterribacter sp. TaxID=2821509 RepID=UPI002C35DC55|nr:hypothetical protein [Agriterribacter sp.]HRO44525.1 hypothetical protein [Agriterribacter sp.]HRQ16449.1 hypothetical protein [Agriterribacter sp.]
MKHKYILFFSLIALAVCSSCNRYYYKPNGVNAPLFTDGGQAHLNVAGSIGGNGGDYDYEGTRYVFDLQGSVSPVKHLGIIANYSTYDYTPDNPDAINGNVDGKAHLLEFGVGGYYAKGNKFKMVADCYVGYGTGQIRSDVDMRLKRFFIQPGIGVRSPAFDAAFNLRLVSAKYDHFNAKGMSNDYLLQQNLINSSGRRIDNTNYAFVEPSFTVRTGYKFLKVQLQTVFAQEITSVPWDYSPARYTVGLYFSLEDAIAEAMKGR